MTYNIISTGSKGNALVLNESVLLDCGVPMKSLGKYAGKIRLILIGHEHGDHFKESTVRTFKRYPLVRFGCGEWLAAKLLKAGIPARNVDIYEMGKEYSYGFVQIKAEPLVHDVPNCCFHLKFQNGEKFLYAVDTATLDHITAENYDCYFIERNFEESEINERIERKLESGQYIYEYRAKRTHLSQQQAEDWLARNAGQNSRYVFLHQHEENSTKNAE